MTLNEVQRNYFDYPVVKELKSVSLYSYWVSATKFQHTIIISMARFSKMNRNPTELGYSILNSVRVLEVL